MLTLIKKDFFRVFLNLFLILPLFTFYLGVRNYEVTLDVVNLLAAMMVLIIIGGVSNSEQYEEKFNGYRFLSVLPLDARLIVTSKFLLFLLLTVAVAGYDCLLLSFFPASPETLYLARSFLVLVGMVSLISIAPIYMVVFIFGFDRMVRLIVVIFMILLAFSPILFREFILPDMEINLSALIDFTKSINWWLAVAGTLVVYFGLMLITVRIKKTRPVY